MDLAGYRGVVEGGAVHRGFVYREGRPWAVGEEAADPAARDAGDGAGAGAGREEAGGNRSRGESSHELEVEDDLSTIGWPSNG